MSAIRWGMLGAGWIAKRAIAPAMHTADGARLEAVGARDAGRARSLSPSGRVHGDYASVIHDPDVDAVYIALSNDGHLPWAVAALEAGKPVLCEKPLGSTAADARVMRDVADRTGTLLVEATWNLWHPRTQRAMALLATDTIGSLESLSATFVFDGVDTDNYRLDPARGGGALLDVGCYPLTTAAWSCRTGVFDVVETTSLMSESGVDLTTDARLRMGGVDVHVRGSFREPDHQSILLVASEGALEFTGNDSYVSWLTPSALRVVTGLTERLEHFAPVDPYRLMIEHVSRAISGEDAWLPDPRWSITVADAMDAILRHATGAEGP